MNNNAKSVLKNINYTVSANFIVMGISILLNLFVPRYLGVNEYSYWQLYVFYSGYVGFFHLGWLDGIYLKIGGEKYSDLDKRDLGTQFWYLLISQTLIATILLLLLSVNDLSGNRFYILLFTAVILVITNCRTFLLFILQSTNRIKEYAQLSRNDRYIYLIVVFSYLLFGGRSFLFLIILDILSKLIVVLWGIYRIKDLIFVRWMPFGKTVKNIFNNIKIGINLMVGNIASMLVMGITRLFVERQWSIEVFGKLSLTISISNMFMTFINAVGVVMFPLLRRTDSKNLKKLYLVLRGLFVPITYGLLLSFIPLKIILGIWLPQYTQSLIFMGILFPMVIYEGRMALLISTYLKTIRKEKIILLVNVSTLLISLCLSLISVYVFKNIYLTVFSIMICIGFRCVFAELLLAKELGVNITIETFFETVLTIIFIVANFSTTNLLSFIIYLVCFSGFILIRFNKIQDSFKSFKSIMKS
jgi:O-antigen/teichoic acid export membrane protein